MTIQGVVFFLHLSLSTIDFYFIILFIPRVLDLIKMLHGVLGDGSSAYHYDKK